MRRVVLRCDLATLPVPARFRRAGWTSSRIRELDCLEEDTLSVEQSSDGLTRARYRWDGETWTRTGYSLRVPQALSQRAARVGVVVGAWEHGTSVAGCRAELVRKTAVVVEQEARRAREVAVERDRRREERVARILARISCRPVVAGDVRAVGACDPGIRSWCESRGVDPEGTLALGVLGRDPASRPYAVAIARRLLAVARGAS
jgi:hypothetical protein